MSAPHPSNTMLHPPAAFAATANVGSLAAYLEMYERSIRDPEGFWAEIARRDFHWQAPWTRVCRHDFRDKIEIRWFEGAKTNVCHNAVDRHLATRADQTAILWEGNQPGDDGRLTFRELHEQVCRAANALRAAGVRKGDRVSIYMPMIPELAVAVLACARIGAVHSVVFGGFSPDSLADRILDSGCEVLLTADGAYRGKKSVELKKNADAAMRLAAERGTTVRACLVVQHITGDAPRRAGVRTTLRERIPDGAPRVTISMEAGRDRWWHEALAAVSPDSPIEWHDSEDPLFILYTSGSTGKPKGVLHTTGGYMVHAATTFKYVFDQRSSSAPPRNLATGGEADLWWCTADIGWVTGHSYIVYGPLCNGATTLMFEGIPTYPDAGRFWDVVDKYGVARFYTAPTAIRALMREGDQHVRSRKRSTLRLLGTVGEPINPEAWLWYHRVVGDSRCPIVDTWWQTETGGILISPLPGATPAKPGSATLPFFGVQPVMLNPETGKELDGPGAGVLALKGPWPGIMRTVFGDHERFKNTYFSMYPGYYFTGDGCRRDEDGYWWITGRVDDVINVAGHRLGTAEIESALVSHPAVAEAAVCGFPHDLKGQGIYAYVTLRAGREYAEPLKAELRDHVRNHLSAIATPDVIHWAPGLPKTRSGKIMRRILRKIAEAGRDTPASELLTTIGDTTTLAEPSVVEDLIRGR
ncbi:MAG: acetate--CoA ligase [Phycisphaerae bacterium]|nr:acetate--CoA ligase [Phycisphaerae bacterium]